MKKWLKSLSKEQIQRYVFVGLLVLVFVAFFVSVGIANNSQKTPSDQIGNNDNNNNNEDNSLKERKRGRKKKVDWEKEPPSFNLEEVERLLRENDSVI